jgi:hypothetical protein
MNQRLKESQLNPEDFPQVQMSVGRHTYATGLTIKAFPSFNSHKITIGAFCSFAEGITIIAGGEHFYRRFTTFPINLLCEDQNLPWHEGSKGDITIGNDVWIGYGATILSGVTIGDGFASAGWSLYEDGEEIDGDGVELSTAKLLKGNVTATYTSKKDRLSIVVGKYKKTFTFFMEDSPFFEDAYPYLGANADGGVSGTLFTFDNFSVTGKGLISAE